MALLSERDESCWSLERLVEAEEKKNLHSYWYNCLSFTHVSCLLLGQELVFPVLCIAS